ncbi:disA bacterial checkpoint controller nucleotide-binding family protein [Streptococcus pyogenes]|uniref:diadenylate cyclase CdaA n=1 Tax=Streptococcus pyogenes TaxID=1314 RepID=UPI00109D5568|nr:diadenylate cyclase CdaA [Streptococcus pyogenes]VGQ58782.1 disA bacterial checkpoint controller nucleotide-binding family protein [Streptococcus pyogenes]VGU91965.1 disA bacterial checkpoint controller nucleotide-binding family protein [Streptococcus pyogenes]VGV25847.1 disA bacterial checkpoint controller nucleotide-binding family protein [Streptococcus pyogenes]VGV96297.1 disA bacterial checkpoint controller nucleotide-binding family protein [Streptococcus pyogenes]VHA98372.1 disA bacter
MNNLSSIDIKFLLSLFADPWLLAVHLLDILIVAYLIYRFIKALTGTKIMSLVQGVIFFLVLRFIAEWIGFTTITYLMNQVITYGVIAGVVIFTPEIRAGLEKFGRSTQVFLQKQYVSSESALVDALIKSVAYMGPRKIGALIAIEQTQTLQEYIATGIPLNADISSQLLINIFIPNTPLHDGAVIVGQNKIVAACAYLPLSESKAISKEFGTRHRAAIGLSENSDALTIIVSEETGAISVTRKGQFLHDLSADEFETVLRTYLMSDSNVSLPWYKKILGGKSK